MNKTSNHTYEFNNEKVILSTVPPKILFNKLKVFWCVFSYYIPKQ